MQRYYFFLFYSFFIKLMLFIQPVFRFCPEALKSAASIDSVINDFFVINERMPDADEVDEMLVAVNGSRSKPMSLVCFRKHVARYSFNIIYT